MFSKAFYEARIVPDLCIIDVVFVAAVVIIHYVVREGKLESRNHMKY